HLPRVEADGHRGTDRTARDRTERASTAGRLRDHAGGKSRVGATAARSLAQAAAFLPEQSLIGTGLPQRDSPRGGAGSELGAARARGRRGECLESRRGDSRAGGATHGTGSRLFRQWARAPGGGPETFAPAQGDPLALAPRTSLECGRGALCSAAARPQLWNTT